MSRIFEFPANREPTFPDRCVCCGKPREDEGKMTVSRLIQERRKQVNRSLELRVPLCARCKRADQTVFLYSLLAFVLGGLVAGGACIVLLLAAESKSGFLTAFDQVPGRAGGSLLVLGGIAFIVGVAAGFLVEAVARVLAIPFLGRAMYWAPIMAVQFLGDVEYAAGLRASLSKDATTLKLQFFNTDVANDFEALNVG